MRVGIGFDVHKLVEDGDLILGGVTIDYSLGLLGHSDADVLLHAIKDALLGAIGEGDIGRHFPDTDPQYKGISSLKLLKEVANLIEDKGYILNNLDTTIIAQKPKLAPYIERMQRNIAEVLRVDINKINLKATTTEGLGFIGKKEGIAAQAIVSVVERKGL
ncbi:2-C-methyl-D-erythritol 2,4-cyclodiphosphate synthase [Orenia marismortui]|uniref:2-C-methyl-D-erythritol 2,4-cyclodiphosphate synthase n=1 Tax=Orenia marismortui TaxID=46469 RepID=UPI000364A12E|nr:2-C-methyl-D-erythritol 2,4-cyclodiphosphate synthase [Orenia marismortui]